MKVKLNGNDFFEVSSPFGSIDPLHPTGHTGIDLVMNTATKLFSPTDGVVSRIVDYGTDNIGKGVMIKTNDGQELIFGHLSDNTLVKIGQKIHEGDLIALSGNTGFSTGSHLHLGLKDNGEFVNPDKFLGGHEGVITKMMASNAESKGSDGGFINFLSEWRSSGSFFEAMYGKSFFETLKDGCLQLVSEAYSYIVVNGDLFFILPAIIVMFVTFMIGRNKFTKWIVPLWFAFFVSKVLLALNCLPPQN
jgi:Peptidase family M23